LVAKARNTALRMYMMPNAMVGAGLVRPDESFIAMAQPTSKTIASANSR
jgi:hypothetical protein